MTILSAEVIHRLARRALQLDSVNDDFADRLFREYAKNPATGDYLPYYRFLTLTMLVEEPKVAVELGVQRGVAAAHMAAGWNRGLIVGVDKQFDPVATQACEHYDCLRFIQADSVIAAAEIAVFGPIGLLFVDSEHTAEHVRKEIAAYTPLLADNALVLFDNLYHPQYPGYHPVYEAFCEFPHLRLELSELSPGWGFGAALYRR